MRVRLGRHAPSKTDGDILALRAPVVNQPARTWYGGRRSRRCLTD
ncbi:MAG: hypothetical protein ACREND_10015 [Gemmatimonadaceae bacterium]